MLGYMCKTDFDCELGKYHGGTPIYPSVEDLKRHRKCTEQCGIVEVKIEFSKLIQEGTFEEFKEQS